ncbi:MAG TPA: 4Fe-4S dicluster domain-containing protein [Gammaproteobacteria bacterium]|nr:4Fe-4S dicluster domain-containing protein [Gammaproteobacteria bacterium]
MNNKIDSYKRRFLAQSAVITGAAALGGGLVLTRVVQARPASQAVSSKNRWGLLIDTRKCANDCDACVQACEMEHGWGRGSSDEQRSSPAQKAQWIRKVTLRDRTTGHETSLPMMCQHCAHPPCVDVCPTGASMKRDDGIVLVDKHRCIGCRYCMMACPYKARSFIHEDLHGQKTASPRGKGTVESCNLCVHRVDQGKIPACAEACPEKAILFGDLKDADSEIARRLASEPSTEIRGDLRLDLGVRYQNI